MLQSERHGTVRSQSGLTASCLLQSSRGLNANRLQAYVEWVRGTDKLDIDVTTSNRVREKR